MDRGTPVLQANTCTSPLSGCAVRGCGRFTVFGGGVGPAGEIKSADMRPHCQTEDTLFRGPDVHALGAAGRWCAVMVCLAGIGVMWGCQEPVLTPDEPRSQYDRFDTVRDQRAPSYVMDEYGQRKPNIRARLLTGE